ncbi:MAG: dihydroorotate dehydrogenase [Eubacterium sp.]|nr:dihydroorotate dehydrogenase [Eubacterium sp.]
MINEVNLKVNIAGVEFKNPITVASGTFGSGEEYSEFVKLSDLGAVTTKGVSAEPWEGNDTPRVAETPAGMLNAIGLQNPGADLFIKRDVPFLRSRNAKIIVNVCGHTIEEYIECVKMLNEADIDMIELNISCPNVSKGGIAFGTNPRMVKKITKKVKRASEHPVVVKLSPNVTDITETAKAAEKGGADAVSLINTFTGMKIDIDKQDFFLANRTGGLSGPAVHPIAVRMIHDVAQAVDIPIIGMGGVMNAEDAIEMILAGATMVAVGTANFNNPRASVEIVEGIENYLKENDISDVNDIVGIVK